jgi:hypothetical protein
MATKRKTTRAKMPTISRKTTFWEYMNAVMKENLEYELNRVIPKVWNRVVKEYRAREKALGVNLIVEGERLVQGKKPRFMTQRKKKSSKK